MFMGSWAHPALAWAYPGSKPPGESHSPRSGRLGEECFFSWQWQRWETKLNHPSVIPLNASIIYDDIPLTKLSHVMSPTSRIVKWVPYHGRKWNCIIPLWSRERMAENIAQSIILYKSLSNKIEQFKSSVIGHSILKNFIFVNSVYI